MGYENEGDHRRGGRFTVTVNSIKRSAGDNRAQRGTELFENGHYDEAKREFEAALRIYRDAKFRPGESRMLSLLALCSFAMDELDDSLNLLSQSVRFKGEIGDLEGGATDLMAMGKVRMAMGDAETAMESFSKAKEFFEELDMPDERREAEDFINQVRMMLRAQLILEAKI